MPSPAKELEIFRESLARRMAEALEKSGLRQSTVADRIGIQRAHMSGCLKGQSFPSVQVLAAFARATHTSADFLLFGDAPGANLAPRPPTKPQPVPRSAICPLEIGAPFEPSPSPHLALVVLADGRQWRGLVSAGKGGDVHIAPYPSGEPITVGRCDVLHCLSLMIR